jgi:hypothetical protein
MNQLYWPAVTPGMRKLMATFAMSRIGKSFYLAGGTALALQLGHRRSGDLNYYSPTEDIHTLEDTLHRSLESVSPLMADSGWGSLVFLVGGVCIGFFSYSNALIAPLVEADGIGIASVTDIALMKMEALLERAERIDFLDLYAICQRQPLRGLLDLAPRKYPDVGDFSARVIKRLVYFERADEEYSPPLLEPVEWDAVKKFFRKQAADLGWVEGG